MGFIFEVGFLNIFQNIRKFKEKRKFLQKILNFEYSNQSPKRNKKKKTKKK